MWRRAPAFVVAALLPFAFAAFELHAYDVPRAGARSYQLDDYFEREEIASIAVDPSGRLLAVERIRSASAGENYVGAGYSAGDYYSRRSDILVIDTHTGTLIRQTNGRAQRETNFAAAWSPDGAELAFLRSRASGSTSLVVWKISTGRETEIEQIDVDLTVLFTRGISSAEDSHNFFVWSGDSRLLVASRGSMSNRPLGPGMLDEISRRWNATWQGSTSARIWDSEAIPVCNDGVRLFEIDRHRGQTVELFSGPLLAVSVAPNSNRIAVVSARRELARPHAGPLYAAKARRVANRNEYGFWQVDVIDRTFLTPPKHAVATGAGEMARGVLPRWSADASRLAIVVGNEPIAKAGYGTLLFDSDLTQLSRVAATSLVDAEALAAFYVAAGLRRISSDIWTTPKTQVVMGDGIGSDARAFRLSGGRTAIQDRRGVGVIGGDGQRQSLGDRASIVHVVHKPERDRILLEDPTGIRWVDVLPARIENAPAIRSPANARSIGIGDQDNVIFSVDGEDGTAILSVSTSGATRTLLHTNGHMADIARPTSVTVSYSARGEAREGVLYLPTNVRLGDKSVRVPVVVTAYPMTVPLREVAPAYIGNVNSVFAWHWHPILASGFAVYAVDFRRPAPVDPSSRDYIETPELITSEVIPAIDALRREPVIDSSRLAFVGFSQGGYTAVTLLARTNLFRAIVAEAPLANLSTNLSATPELRLDDCAPRFQLSGLVELEAPDGFIRLGDAPYNQRTRFVDYSPVFNLEKAVTPTLMFAAELDPYGPAGPEQIFMMLLRKGVPAKLVVYWGENHVISSPGNMRDMIDQEIAWLRKHLLN